MDRSRKRARVDDGAAVGEWTLHDDQRLLGVWPSAELLLVAAGERHAQIRVAERATVGKLVALESGGRWRLERARDGAARFYVATPWDTASSSGLRVLDACAMAFTEVPFPRHQDDPTTRPTGPLDGAFVEGDTGEAIALVEHCGGVDPVANGACWRLWCWQRRDEERALDSPSAAGAWTTRTLATVATPHEACAWDARFYTSPVFGRCLHVVGVVMGPEISHGILTSELFAVDDDWALVHKHEQIVSMPSTWGESEEGQNASLKIWLSPSLRWIVVRKDGGQRLACVKLHPFDASRSPTSWVKAYADVAVDVAFNGDFVAVLCANGPVDLMELPHLGDQPLVVDHHEDSPVSFSRFTEKMGTSRVVWDRLVWFPRQHMMLACCGSKTVRIPVYIDNTCARDEQPTRGLELSKSSSVLMSKHMPSHAVHRRSRRLRPRSGLEAEQDFSLFGSDATSTTNATDIFSSIRFIVFCHDNRAMDAIFTLLGILLQRVLRSLGLIKRDKSLVILGCEDIPIQVGIMEMLLAEVVLAEYSTFHLIASKVVQAPPFASRPQRRSYYHDEMHWIALSSPTCLQPSAAQHRHFVRCIIDALCQLRTAEHTFEIPHVKQSARQTSTVFAINEATALLKIVQREVDKGGRCSAWFHLKALISVFTIASDLSQRSRFVLDVPILISCLSVMSLKLREAYVGRFLTTAPPNPLATETPEDRYHHADVMRALAAKSGVISSLVGHSEADDLNLLELMQSTKRPNDKDGFLPRQSLAISIEAAGKALNQLASMFWSSPLFIRFKKNDAAGLSGTPPWITSTEDNSVAFDSFIKLVFVSTDVSSIRDELVTGYLNSSSRTHVFDFDEIDLKKKVLRLAGSVMFHVKQVAVSIDGRNTSESLPQLFREVFLFDKLWSPTATVLQTRDILQYVNEVTISGNGQDQVHSMFAQVTGLPTNSGHFERLKLDGTPENGKLRQLISTLAILVWSFWVRERMSFCKQAIEDFRRLEEKVSEEQQTTAAKLGYLAASCALHLKTLALYRDGGADDEITSAQLFFLDAAIELNYEAASKIVAWAFSSETLSARHMKRFRTIHHTARVNDSGDTGQLRSELRRAVLETARAFGSITISNELLDAFGTCCCDGSFQRVLWALLQRRFTIGTTPGKSAGAAPIKKILQTRPSTVDGLISRHEVANLLLAQRQEIEEQVQRLREATESRLSEATESKLSIVSEDESIETSQQKEPDTKRNAQVLPSQLPAMIKDSVKVFEVRDLNPRYRSHNELLTKADQNTPRENDVPKPQRGSSSQNVLKLLQLRKETQGVKRHQSAPRMVGIPMKTTLDSQKTGPSNEVPKVSTGQRGVRQRGKEPVLPLKRDHPETAQVVLLTTSDRSSKKTIPVARRSFRLAIPPESAHSITADRPPECVSSAVQCTETRSTSIQTDQIECITHAPAESIHQPEPDSQHLAATQTDVQSVSVGVQFQGNSLPLHEPTANIQAAATISNRFPVFVDLEGSSNAKYLHVVPMKKISTQSLPQEVYVSTRNIQLKSGSDASVGDAMIPTIPEEIPESESHNDQALSQAQLHERRRLTYRAHFPTTAQLLRGSRDRNHSAAVGSFSSLKSEMERMKAKLAELEDCARDLDDEFKVSHHKLEHLGKGMNEDTKSVLDVVTDAIDATDSAQDATQGTLSTKAARDLGSARHLLEQLERLTTAE